MNAEQTAINERALQELASIQANVDNKRDPATYENSRKYLSELVSDLPKDRQAHFFAEAKRLKLKLDVNRSADDGQSPTVDPNRPTDQSQQPGGASPHS